MPAPFPNLKKDFNSLIIDLRAEVLGAEFIKNGISADQLSFRTVGGFRRPTGKDVQDIQTERSDKGEERLTIRVNREGIYDMLPEGVFHFHPGDKKEKKGKQKVLENIRESRNKEQFARKFFAPIEDEFRHVSLQLENRKRSLLQPGAMDRNRELFESIYGDCGILNEYQLLALLYILPIVHKIRGDLDKIGRCIALLIGYRVAVFVRSRPHAETLAGNPPRLGTAALGIDTVLGNSFQSFNKFYDISIENIEKERLTAFFPGGDRCSVIQYVSNFLFPYDSHVRIIPEVQIADREAQLSNPENESYLGFNCYLGGPAVNS
jgi:hypothetical protein